MCYWKTVYDTTYSCWLHCAVKNSKCLLAACNVARKERRMEVAKLHPDWIRNKVPLLFMKSVRQSVIYPARRVKAAIYHCLQRSNVFPRQYIIKHLPTLPLAIWQLRCWIFLQFNWKILWLLYRLVQFSRKKYTMWNVVKKLNVVYSERALSYPAN